MPVLLMLQVQPGHDTEPVHAANPIYIDAIRSGFQAECSAVNCPRPILRTDSTPASSVRRCWKLAGSEPALEDLLRESVTARFS